MIEFLEKNLNLTEFVISMINKIEFKRMNQELKQNDLIREYTIAKSREVLKLSKQVIYALHRNDLEEATKKFALLKNEKSKLDSLMKKRFDKNLGSAAYQEFVEAATYLDFIQGNKIQIADSLKVPTEEYLLGVCDLTGELVRLAVACSIRKDHDMVIKIKEFISDLYKEFLEFDLRNSELRKKSDSIRWNLNKIEDLILGIKLN